MTKDEHIKYWIDIAEKDWDIAQKLYSTKDFVYCLFFAHLVIEKISKAHWVKCNQDNFPPKVHNVVYLLDQSTVQLDNEQTDFLLLLNGPVLREGILTISKRYIKFAQKNIPMNYLLKLKRLENGYSASCNKYDK